MILVNFTRLFTSGNLEGLTHDDKITFVNYELAQDWVNNYNASDNHLIEVKVTDLSELTLILESALESANEAYFNLQRNWEYEMFAKAKENKLVAEIQSIKNQLAAL